MSAAPDRPLLRTAFGALLLGGVLAECLRAVRAGALPLHDLSSAFAIAAVAVIVALASGIPGKHVAAVAVWGLLFVLSSQVDDDHPRGRSFGITLLFAGGGFFLASAPTTHRAIGLVALSALAGAVLRWLTFA